MQWSEWADNGLRDWSWNQWECGRWWEPAPWDLARSVHVCALTRTRTPAALLLPATTRNPYTWRAACRLAPSCVSAFLLLLVPSCVIYVLACEDPPESCAYKHICEWQARQLLEGLEQAIPSTTSTTLRIATMCSGSDVIVKGMEHSVAWLREHGGCDLQLSHTMSVENDSKMQWWISRGCPDLDRLFSDVADMGNKVSINVLTGHMAPIPSNVDLLVAGFSCRSVSSENNGRASFADCCADGDGTTGETWSHSPVRTHTHTRTHAMYVVSSNTCKCAC